MGRRWTVVCASGSFPRLSHCVVGMRWAEVGSSRGAFRLRVYGELALVLAIKPDGFLPCYFPEVSIRSHRCHTCNRVLSWRLPNKTLCYLISSDRFHITRDRYSKFTKMPYKRGLVYISFIRLIHSISGPALIS